MPSSYTTSLRLTLPATGELAGQWGSTVNTGITELLDAAVAGTTVISTWGGAGVPYTLSNNSGTADEARKMFIVATGTPGEAKNVICPAVSKLYVFRNDTTGGFALTLKTSGGTGIAVPAGQYKMLYCDGTNVVEAVNSPGPVASLSASQAVFTDGSKNLVSNAVTGTGNVVMSASPTLTGTVAGASLQLSSLTSGRVTYAGASGLLQDSTNLTFDGTSLTLGGNPTLSAGTANGVAYANASKVLTTGSALTYNGSALSLYSTVAGLSIQTALNTNQATITLADADGRTAVFRSPNSGSPNAAQIGTTTNHDVTFLYGGSEQMRLTSTGLGIGTSSPAYKLDVQNTSNTSARIWTTGGTIGNYAELKLTAYNNFSGQSQAYLRAISTASGNSGTELAFATEDNGFGGPVERMRLTSTGLGIGESSPGYKLDVYGGSSSIRTNGATASQITYSVAGTETAIAYVDATQHILGSSTAIPVLFRTGGTEKMRLDSPGNLGLGVTPSVWGGVLSKALEFNNGCYVTAYNTSGTDSIYVGANNYYNGSNYIYKNSRAASQYQQTGGAHYWYTAPSGTAGNAISFTQAMTLDASGNLLVGKTSSTYAGSNRSTFEINNTDSSIIALQYGGANGYYLQADSTAGYLWNSANTPLVFGTNNTERARITSGGDLLVGTTSPYSTAKMTVESTANIGIVSKQGTVGGYCFLSYALNNGGTYYHASFEEAGTQRGSITSNGSATAYNTSSDYRLKDNPQPLTGSGAFIDALQPKTWNWKTDGKRGVGFIAHEAQVVSPSSVVGEKDAIDEDGKPVMQAMEYGSAEFIANIIAELQSLRARVAALEAQP